MSTAMLLAVAGLAAVVGLVLVIVPALAAVRRYPHAGDPDRARRRYVAPAVVGCILALAGLVVLVIGSIGTIVAAVSETVT